MIQLGAARTHSASLAASRAIPARQKVCLVSAAGGHLDQILKVRSFLGDVPVYLVTVRIPPRAPDGFGCKTYYVHRILRNPVRLLVNFLQSLFVFVRENPGVVISTGSGEALPTFILASCLGRRTIFVESFARVRTLSATGRILRRFADTVLVQWRALLAVCPDAAFAGPVFVQRPSEPLPTGVKVLLTVGTQTRGFDRLIRTMDAFSEARPPGVQIVAQIGTSEYEPHHMKWFRFLSPGEFSNLLEWADVVVTHSGAGLIGEALELGKRIIVAPRDRSRGETMWGGDAELPTALSELGVVEFAAVEEVPAVLARVGSWTPKLLVSGQVGEELIRALNE